LSFIQNPKARRKLKINLVRCEEPQNIKAKIGPLILLNISLRGREDETLIEFNFDFSQFITIGTIASISALLADLIFSRHLYSLTFFVGGGFLFSLIYADTYIIERFMNQLDSFLNSRGITIKKIEVEEAGERRPLDVDALYERLTHRYDAAYGRGVRMVERKIQSYMKEGLSREEAIKKLAEEEGLLERAEEKPKPKPSLPPGTLYKRLLYKYSVYGRSVPALEHKIEELTSLGLSREEAIRKIAEEEGIT